MSDISHLASRMEVGGEMGSGAVSCPYHYTTPGSGRGAGRGVAFTPLAKNTVMKHNLSMV